MPAAQKKILVVLTSADTATNGKPTGFYLPEMAHPYYALKDSFNLTFVSPKGGVSPCDPASIEAFKGDDESVAFLADKDAQKLIQTTSKLGEVNTKDFDAVFYPGGHGPVVDLAFDEDSYRIIREFYEAGKPTAAVCHAPAIFKNVLLSNGEPIIKGKHFAGFTNSEEAAVNGEGLVPFLLETELVKLGGILERVDDWGVKVVVDGNLVTGQNPASAGPLAQKLKEILA